MNDLNGKKALITGGNSGIGYATAKELKAQGATVIITGRRKDAVEKAAAALGVIGLVADQSDITAIDRLANEVEKTTGKIDILFINAGVVEQSSIADATEKIFDTIIDINFKGAYFTLSKFIPMLNDGGSVVFLSSNTASMDLSNSSIYSSGKAALNSVMRIAAVELAPRQIRVNSVSPGPTATEIMNKKGLDAEQLAKLNQWMVDRIPLKKIGKSEDVAKMVAFFCGENANFITGAEIVMDGGMSLKG